MYPLVCELYAFEKLGYNFLCCVSGLSGWGIAYYINDTMIPVLRLRRNVTYTFIVEAGNDPNDGPNYHPFYITDSEVGGILLDTPEQRMVCIY